MQQNSNSNKLLNISLILLGILAVVLLFAAMFLGWQYVNLNNSIVEKENIIMKQNLQKDSLALEIEELKSELRVQQDLYNVEVESVIGQLENLKVNLRSTGDGNIGHYKAEIKKLKEEIAQLKQNVSVHETEELNYKQQIEKLMYNISQLENKNKELEGEKQVLNTKVETGAVLQISAIECKSFFVSKKGKEKEIAKAGKVNKLECCFTVFKNKIAEKTPRTAYLIIKKPDGEILKSEHSDFFETSTGLMNYTAKKQFQFQGENVEVCISVDLKDDLDKGKYAMEVYIDNAFTSEQTIDLK